MEHDKTERNEKTKQDFGLSAGQIASAHFAMMWLNLPVLVVLFSVVYRHLISLDGLPFWKFAGTCAFLGLIVFVFRLRVSSRLGWLRCRYWADERFIIKRVPGCEEERFEWADLRSATCKSFVDKAGFGRRLMTKLIGASWIPPSIVLTFSGGRKMTIERIGIPRYWYQECIFPIADSGPPGNALALLLANMIKQQVSDTKVPKARLYIYAIMPGITLYFVSLYMKRFVIPPDEEGTFKVLMVLGIVIAVLPAVILNRLSKRQRSKNPHG